MDIERQKNKISEMVNGFERILIMRPMSGFIHMHMVLKRGNTAVQFVVYVPLPHAVKLDARVTGMDVGYHSPVPMYSGQSTMGDEDCPYTNGACYYDGSSLRGDEWAKKWIKEGNDAIWADLEKEWHSRFDVEG